MLFLIHLYLFRMAGGKRQRLDDEGRSIRQLELELELARLRREEAADQEVELLSVDETENNRAPAPPPAPQSNTAETAAPPPSTPQLRQQIPPNQSQSGVANTSATAAPPHSAPQQWQQNPPNQTPGSSTAGRGRGRVGRAGRGGRPAGGGGVLTVMVCVIHDNLYCQTCNNFEPSYRYWERH